MVHQEVRRTESCEYSGYMGISRADITPPRGITARTWGSSKHDFFAGIHKPLLATCAVFAGERGANELVLLTADLGWWRSRTDESDLREPILQRARLRPDQLMLHPSHTHAAPTTALEFADRPGGEFIAPYRERLLETFNQLIERARAALEPATLTWAWGRCGLAFNRNFSSPDDGQILCGLNPRHEADDTLLVGRISDSNARIQGTLVNYACHPTSLGSGNQLVSPDYIGAMRETIEEQIGGTCVFMHGASGDLTPRRSFETDPAMADENGRELGYAALATIASMLPPGRSLQFAGTEESGTRLAIWRQEPLPPSKQIGSHSVALQLPIKDMLSTSEIHEAMATCRDAFMLERLKRQSLLRQTVGEGPLSEFKFQVWQLGGTFIVGLPAEAHSSFQMAVRSAFPETRIAVMNIVNGYLSYLPPSQDYDLNTYQSKVALYKAPATEQVLDAVVRTIRGLSSSQ